MPLVLSPGDKTFPSVDNTDEYGVIAIGGDFCSERLLNAYRAGIFPWPHPDLPIMWFCPDPRFVLRPNHVVISQSLAKAIRQTTLTIKANTDFVAVMKRCQAANRRDHAGTWITNEMIDGYYHLHKNGFAHSIEAFDQNRLVGGLYGVSIGKIFFGESMFFEQSNASKICFVLLVAHLIEWRFTMIDCQAHTDHLQRFGANFISRKDFLDEIVTNNLSFNPPTTFDLHMTPKQALDHLRNARGG